MVDHTSAKMKQKILVLYKDKKYTQEELAKIFNISSRTLRRWLQNDYLLERDNRKAISYKVKEKHINYAIKMLKKEPTISMRQ